MLLRPLCKRDGVIAKSLLFSFTFAVLHYLILKTEHKDKPPDHYTTEREFSTEYASVKTPTADNPQENLKKTPTVKAHAFVMRKGKDNSNSAAKKKFQEGVFFDMDEVWTEEQMETQRRIFEERAENLSANCKKLSNHSALHPNITKVHDNIRWVSKHELIWCPVYKAASTTWMSNLLLLAGMKTASNSFHKQVKKLYPPPKNLKKRKHLLENSMRMLIVRHPMERLLSAYRDKMLRLDQFVRVSSKVKTSYKDPNAKEDDEHPTFRQFLMYIKDTMTKFWNSGGSSRVNPHWQPVWWTCGPCQILYNNIAHMETLTLDQEYIIRKAGLKDVIFNAHTHASNLDSFNGTDEASRSYFSQVPKFLLREVADLYRADFELFGYSPNAYVQMGTDEK